MMEPDNSPSQAPPLKERRWAIGLLVGCITAIISAVAAAPVSDWAMDLHHVSNFEGGRGYAVMCMWIPLGFILGFLTGFLVSLLVSGSGSIGFLKRQGTALLALAVIFAVGAGLSYATADHPPLINNQPLALDIQIQVAKNGRTISELRAQDFSVALVASSSDRSYADLRWNESSVTNDTILVAAWAQLNSRNAGREITVGTASHDRQIFSVILPATPATIDEQWSQWATPRETFSGTMPPPNEQYHVRYRVRLLNDYSPTPGYTPAVEPSPQPTGDNNSLGSSTTPTPDPQGAGTTPNDWLDRGLIPPSPSPTETPRP